MTYFVGNLERFHAFAIFFLFSLQFGLFSSFQSLSSLWIEPEAEKVWP